MNLARPQKEGLDYFPLDVDIDQDDKVQLIEAQFGIVGFGIVIKLLMKIYKEGYFYEWTEKEQLLLSKRINVDINQVNDVINECLRWGLFDKNLYDKCQILTSKGIQKRYMEAVMRRKQVLIVREYFLLDASKYLNIVFVSINSINDDINTLSSEVNVNINPQSKVKKSKVKKSKEDVSDTDNHVVDGIVDNSVDNLAKELSIHYENCFRKLIVPIHIDTLKSFINDGMELDLVKTIMEYSSTKEDPFAYCRKVLNNCMGRKILTKAEFELNLKTKPSSKVQQATNRFTNIYEHNWDFDKLEKLEMEYIDKKVAEMNGG